MLTNRHIILYSHRMPDASFHRLTRRNLLGGWGAAGLAMAGARSGEAAKAALPNIVFVFSDQQRNASWPGGGEAQAITPNTDRLAREGAVFTHCISNYPLCSPYRASLLTGRYPQATTITYNVPQAPTEHETGAAANGLPTTEVTIADVLKKAGYATGYVGKWHLYPYSEYPFSKQGKLVPPGPHRHGFDYWRVSHNYGDRWDTRSYDDSGKEFVLRGYAPTVQMDQTLEFIGKNAGRPFCVFLSWHPPHTPYEGAPREFVKMYPPEKFRLRSNVPKDADIANVREAYNGYFAHITAMDRELGRLLARLAQLGIAENTILCYSSDHGDMLGSLNEWAKRKPWDESIRVPFLVRWPAGIRAGLRLDHLFSTPDITPTLLGLAGIPALSRMQGIDFSAALRGNPMSGPESAFLMARGGLPADLKRNVEEIEPGAKKKTAGKDLGQWRGVRTVRYTYARVQQRAVTPWVLYDNEKDPFQMRNLVREPAYAGTRKELDAMIDHWRQRLGEA